MSGNYTKIIAAAFQAVLETISGAEVINTSISEGEPEPQDIIVMIGMEGDVDGRVYMSVSAQAGEKIACSMLGGMDIDGADEIVISAISELCNIVMGNACTDISVNNKRVDIGPPIVVSEYDAAHMRKMCNIKITLDNIGNAQLDLCLKEAV